MSFDMDELILLLSCSDSKSNLQALIEIRTKVIKNKTGLKSLLQENVVAKLVNLLDKTNPKILDVSLSILANLLQEDVARRQLRNCDGIVRLVGVVKNIEESNILCRVWRAIANAAQDNRCCSQLHLLGVSGLLNTALTTLTECGVRQVLIRTCRILGDTAYQRDMLTGEGVLDCLANILVELGEDIELESGNFQVKKTLVKCLAKLSNGASVDQMEKLVGGCEVLVRWAGEELGEVRNNSLGVLVNMSQSVHLRPSLGSLVVECFVQQFDRGELSLKLRDSVVTSLCLYCRESANRIRLREVGGCRLLVQVLLSRDEEMIPLHNRVVNSMLQFIYDNHSLNVLMNEGLIVGVVRLLQDHIDTLKLLRGESCGCQEELNKDSDINIDVEEELDKDPDIKIDVEEVLSRGDADTNDIDKNVTNNEVAAEMMDTNVSEVQNQDQEVPLINLQNKVESQCEGIKDKIETKDNDSADNPESTANDLVSDVPDEEVVKSESHLKNDSTPVFRITSPSYQAVQYELEQFRLLRFNRELNLGLSSYPSSPLSPPCSDWSPGTPTSLGSPDRTPTSPMSCSYSPNRSPTYSPSASPPYSPQQHNYSPVENFSDEEEEEGETDNNMGGSKGPINPDPTSMHQPSDPSNSNQQPDPIPGTSNDTDPNQLIPWTKRTLRITRTHTYLGQTFTLPTRSESPPPKRPRLELPVSPYKYSSSPLPNTKPSPVITKPQQSKSNPILPTSNQNNEDDKKITWILQILSRLSQADRPHYDLTSSTTLTTLFSYMSLAHETGVKTTGKILTRMSTNLYCLIPFLLGRHFSYLSLELEQLDLNTEDCVMCRNRLEDVGGLVKSLGHNMTLLAETGYGEGEICHRLVSPTVIKDEKLSITVSSGLLVSQRKLLRNILVTHDSLDMLLDLFESDSPSSNDDSWDLFSHAVLTLSRLAGHLGVVSPSLVYLDSQPTEGECLVPQNLDQEDILIFQLDDGSTLTTSRSTLTNSCPVFAAMLGGNFSESDSNTVSLPQTSRQALSCLLHHLHSCVSCPELRNMTVPTLLELVSLSDKFLLPDLNLIASHGLLRLCLSGHQLVEVYKLSLQKSYQVSSDQTLSQATISLILVANITTKERVNLVRLLVGSELRGDFIDDVGKTLRSKLFERV